MDIQADLAYRFPEWYDAKYGELDVRMLEKMSTVWSSGIRICAAGVMGGNANDSQSLGRLPHFPMATCNDLLADAACADKTRCAAAAKT